MDIIMEIFMEVIVESYLYACFAVTSKFFPQKSIPKKIQTLIKVLIVILTLALFTAPIIGIILLGNAKGESPLGWGLLVVGLLNILSGIILTVRKHLKK